MLRCFRLAAIIVPCFAFATGVLAQSGLAPQALPPAARATTGGWRVSIGAGLLWGPDYLGSNDMEVRPVIAPDIRWRDDTLFLSFRDGLGATLFRDGPFRAGLVLRPRLGRDQDDNAALRGMGDVRLAGEGGVFLKYADGPPTAGP